MQETEDPYGFGLLLGELDLHLFAEGTHLQLGRCLGAQVMEIDRHSGCAFRRLGSQCAARVGRGRLQWLGRAPPPDAQARRSRRLGAVHSATADRHSL